MCPLWKRQLTLQYAEALLQKEILPFLLPCSGLVLARLYRSAEGRAGKQKSGSQLIATVPLLALLVTFGGWGGISS